MLSTKHHSCEVKLQEIKEKDLLVADQSPKAKPQIRVRSISSWGR